jgi:hypothetical protein
MKELRCFAQIRTRRVLLATNALLLGLFILHFTVYGQDKSSFPDGFDAVQAAPKTHKVLFEKRARTRAGSFGFAQHDCAHASSPLAEFTGELGYRRQVATCALSPRERHCEGHSQHGSPHPSRDLGRELDEAGTDAFR